MAIWGLPAGLHPFIKAFTLNVFAIEHSRNSEKAAAVFQFFPAGFKTKILAVLALPTNGFVLRLMSINSRSSAKKVRDNDRF